MRAVAPQSQCALQRWQRQAWNRCSRRSAPQRLPVPAGCWAAPLAHARRLGTAAALPPAAAAAGLAPTARAAAALADVAEGSDLLQFGGALGIALGGAFLALWTLERQAAARNAAEAEAARAEAAALKEEVARLQAELEAEKKLREEAEGLQGRLSDASKNIMKLEKALEIKDGQLDVFMATARRQIKSLEDTVRQLQQMPR